MLDTQTVYNLKQKLVEEKKRLEENLSKTETNKNVDREYETKFTEIERDPEENADEMELYESNLAVDETMKTELEKIDAALARVENGTYGTCSNCKKEILLARLEAYPQADTCLDCKG